MSNTIVCILNKNKQQLECEINCVTLNGLKYLRVDLSKLSYERVCWVLNNELYINNEQQ